ncbi:MAG: MerR family transcriptional regulator [Rhodocyclaceae bacterium]|nr:MerR family transcriptional regulator [Rhodocyclaceae bacterium]
MSKYLIPIGVIERDTGLSKDVLRKWELRYGFPRPLRNESGERHYTIEELGRLRTIKRLIDSGLRPAKAIAMGDGEAELLTRRIESLSTGNSDQAIARVLTVLERHDTSALRHLLAQELNQRGIRSGILDLIAPLTTAVGDAWATGRLGVHQEHLYAETLLGLLHSLLTNLPHGDGPRVLLATPPGEQHTLGIAMLQILLTLYGANAVSLGGPLPLDELAMAADAHQADIVGLSFSIAFPSREVRPVLTNLRQRLPPEVALWAGGSGAARHKRLPEGILRLISLSDAIDALPSGSGTPVPTTNPS